MLTRYRRYTPECLTDWKQVTLASISLKVKITQLYLSDVTRPPCVRVNVLRYNTRTYEYKCLYFKAKHEMVAT